MMHPPAQNVNLEEASMKVPPKRKGNIGAGRLVHSLSSFLASMKVPPKRKGNQKVLPGPGLVLQASMKVPPKRKGNAAE